jgi:hypothetical protein
MHMEVQRRLQEQLEVSCVRPPPPPGSLLINFRDTGYVEYSNYMNLRQLKFVKAWFFQTLWDAVRSLQQALLLLQVQRHLQLRIEAQGKYLQSILEKAKETLANHAGVVPELEAAHAKLTDLASTVITEPGGPSFPSLGVSNLSAHERNAQGVSLPRQLSLVSDTSSQKSYLTNPSAKPEDSGGASGSCEHQVSTGNQHSAKAWWALP